MSVTVEMAKVTSKGQITIPVSIRRRLGIEEGSKLLFIDSPDGVVMVNPDMLNGGQAPDANQAEIDSGKSAASRSSIRAKAETADAAPPQEPDAAPNRSDDAPPTRYASPERPAIEPAAADPIDTSKPPQQVKGLDIGALLDEIRSIGSKI